MMFTYGRIIRSTDARRPQSTPIDTPNTTEIKKPIKRFCKLRPKSESTSPSDNRDARRTNTLEIFGKLRECHQLMKHERSFLHSPQHETMLEG